MTPWSDWTPCSASCGVGKQSRKRSVTLRRVNGKENRPATKATRTCFEGVCPSHCTVSTWGAFSKCTKTCGGGIRGRVRAVVTKAATRCAPCTRGRCAGRTPWSPTAWRCTWCAPGTRGRT